MKTCKKCNIELPLHEFTKVKRNADGHSGSCKKCDNKVKEKNLTPEIQRQRYLRWKETHPTAQRDYYNTIKDSLEYKERSYLYTKQYRENRPGYMAAQCAKRRSLKLQAIPDWEIEFTEFVSEEAHHLRGLRDSMSTFKWHVDHIVPLQGKTFSGLHVWNNLQVIPQTLNTRKLNRNLDEYKWSDYF